jgi:hypothetical protein
MRDLQIELADDEIADEENIEIESAGAVRDSGGTVAAKLALDGVQSVKKPVGGETGLEHDNGVEEARLAGQADGCGGIERGTGGDAAEGPETRCGRDQGSFRRASAAGQVGAESDVGEGHVNLKVSEVGDVGEAGIARLFLS